jgi:hypothetical protein
VRVREYLHGISVTLSTCTQYVHSQVCMYVHTVYQHAACAYMHAHTYTHAHIARTHTHTHTLHTHKYTQTHTQMCVGVCVRVYVCMYVCMYVSMYVYYPYICRLKQSGMPLSKIITLNTTHLTTKLRTVTTRGQSCYNKSWTPSDLQRVFVTHTHTHMQTHTCTHMSRPCVFS